MDIHIGERQAVCQISDGMSHSDLDEGDHVSGIMVEILICVEFGKSNGVRQTVNTQSIKDSKSARDVAFMTVVVFGRGENIPTVNTMRCHVGVLIRREVGNHTSAGWDKRTAVKIEKR